MERSSEGPDASISRFIAFLSAAPLLESLQIDFQPINAQDEDWEDEDDTDMTDMFANLTWSHLNELLVSECRSDRDAFIGFMEGHAGIMEYLRLRSIELTEDQNPNVHSTTTHSSIPSSQLSAPLGAWDHAVKYLAPLMVQLQAVELTCVVDAFPRALPQPRFLRSSDDLVRRDVPLLIVSGRLAHRYFRPTIP